MKITITKEVFTKIFTLSGMTLGGKKVLASLGSLSITVKDNKIGLKSCSFVSNSTVVASGTDGVNGSCIVDGELIMKTIKIISGEKITLDLKKKLRISYEGGKIDIPLCTEAPLVSKKSNDNHYITVSADEYSKALERAIKVGDAKSINTFMRSVHTIVRDDSIFVVGANSFSLFETRVDGTIESNGKISVLANDASVVLKVNKIIKNEKIEISKKDNNVFYTFHGDDIKMILFLKTVEGAQIPSYENFFSMNSCAEGVYDLTGLKNSIVSCSLLGETGQKVCVDMENNVIKTHKSVDVEASFSVDAEFIGDMSLTVDAKNTKSLLDICEGEKIKIIKETEDGWRYFIEDDNEQTRLVFQSMQR